MIELLKYCCREGVLPPADEKLYRAILTHMEAGHTFRLNRAMNKAAGRKDTSGLFRLADAARDYLSGETASAEAKARNILHELPGHPGAQALLGICLARQQRYSEAAGQLESVCDDEVFFRWCYDEYQASLSHCGRDELRISVLRRGMDHAGEPDYTEAAVRCACYYAVWKYGSDDPRGADLSSVWQVLDICRDEEGFAWSLFSSVSAAMVWVNENAGMHVRHFVEEIEERKYLGDDSEMLDEMYMNAEIAGVRFDRRMSDAVGMVLVAGSLEAVGMGKLLTAEGKERSRRELIVARYLLSRYAGNHRREIAAAKKSYPVLWSYTKEYFADAVERPEETARSLEKRALQASGKTSPEEMIADMEEANRSRKAGMIDAPDEEVAWTGRPIGPNELCPCGSGKKYRDCHGAGKFM